MPIKRTQVLLSWVDTKAPILKRETMDIYEDLQQPFLSEIASTPDLIFSPCWKTEHNTYGNPPFLENRLTLMIEIWK